MVDPPLTRAGRTIPVRQLRSIRLVVNADDLGISENIDAGIMAAHRKGIVTATSLMAVGASFDQAVRWCRRTPTLDVGVHLALTAGDPLTGKGSRLVDSTGSFPATVGQFVRRYFSGRIRLTDIAEEWSAQIECILAHGIGLSHLDSHQHVHVLPGIAQLAVGLARHYHIPYVRVPVEQLEPNQVKTVTGALRLVGAIALRESWTLSRLLGGIRWTAQPLRFVGFMRGGRLDRLNLQRILRGLRPGSTYELMCHPGFAPQEPEVRAWNYHHEEELKSLTDPAVRSLLDTLGVQLCGFSDLD